MMWKPLFAELQDHEVKKCFDCDKFPSLDNVPYAGIIQKCWDEGYRTADDVVLALQAATTEEH